MNEAAPNQPAKYNAYAKSPLSSIRHNQRPEANHFYKNASPYSDYENHDFFDSNSSTAAYSPMKKVAVETSDKSTATINDVSTQTDEVLKKHNGVNTNFSEGSTNAENTKSTTNAGGVTGGYYLKKSKLSKHSSRESDGKKLLLEAYLRNNDNITNGGSTTSSGNVVSILNNGKKNGLLGVKTHGPTNTRESGIGTTNDDEVDSLHSAQHEYDPENHHLHHNHHGEKNIDESLSFYDTDLGPMNEQQYNNSDVEEENYAFNRKEKQLKKKSKPKQLLNKPNLAGKQQQLQPGDDSNFPGECVIKSNVYKRNSKQALGAEKIDKIEMEEDHEDDTSSVSLSSFLSRLFAVLLYIFPLGLLFCLVVYYFFVYYFNPKCCDQQRNYLVWNII